MCGIIISSITIPENAKKFVEKRGPDKTNAITYNNINFLHFLLHLTGEQTIQPLIDYENEILVIFNGEIYNYKELDTGAKSDVYSIMSTYKKYGNLSIKHLDGEFTIVIFDFKKNILLITSDIFKTKPLFYNIDNDIIIASYESSCKSIKNTTYNSLKPNETLIFDLNSRKLLEKLTVYDFDLNQYKDNYNDYINAFENAVLKRYPDNSMPIITLSSGLDSGSIACCLNKYNKDSLYLTIPKNENIDVIKKRKEVLKNKHVIIHLNNNEKQIWKNYLELNCEKFDWNWKFNPRVNTINNGFTMGSILGKSKIIDFTKKYDKNIRVLFSGIGADEVMARNQYYSCGYGNVNEFINDLNKIFPWPNFFNGSMENYLKGDEYVGGCFGYENRYPFCDKFVVQEFLWLKPELKNTYKNSIYKPPLMHYLDINNFPYCKNKLGFNV